MAIIDLETLYLILTKVAQKTDFYGYDAVQAGPGQKPGTISSRDLALVYERITGRTIGPRVNWSTPLDQLNLFLSHCGLPAIGKVVIQERGPAPTDEALARAHNAQWPAFSALKNLYKRK